MSIPPAESGSHRWANGCVANRRPLPLSENGVDFALYEHKCDVITGRRLSNRLRDTMGNAG